jgi:photosystem II stability/assembly factor-like uncharacterized protein
MGRDGPRGTTRTSARRSLLIALVLASLTLPAVGGVAGAEDAEPLWTRQSPLTGGDAIGGIAFADADRGVWVNGQRASTLARAGWTVDGGATWNTLGFLGGSTLHAVAFAGPQRVVAVGFAGTVAASSDGGRSWQVIEPAPTSQNLWGLSFPSSDVGWAVGANGAMLATTDGGASWEVRPPVTGATLRDVEFVDEQHGWAVGTGGTILATTDGGATWTAQTSGTGVELYGVAFQGVRTGIVVGDGGIILVTGDGGATWTSRPSGTTESLRAVALPDPSHGWIVGRSGTILATSDGGATWSPQDAGTTAHLTDVTFVDTTRGWAAAGVTLLAYRASDPTPPGVPPTFTAADPPSEATVRQPYAYTFAADGDPAPGFTVAEGELPPGLALDGATGELTGEPTSTGIFAFRIGASNGVEPAAITEPLTITVVEAPDPDPVDPDPDPDEPGPDPVDPEPVVLVVSEAISVTDTVRAAGPAHLTVSETVAVTDATRAAGPAHLTVTETVAVTDATRAAGPAHLTISEDIAVGDDVGPLATVACTELVLGEEVACTVDGLEAEQQAQVTVEVNPTLLDEVLHADDRGRLGFRFTIPATLEVGDVVRLTLTAEDGTVLFASALGRITDAASPDVPPAPAGGEDLRGASDGTVDAPGQQRQHLQRTGGPLGGLVVLALALLGSGVLTLRTRGPRRDVTEAPRRTGSP